MLSHISKNQMLRSLLPLTVILGWIGVWLVPELFNDRIFPYDSALFAANGAFFLSIFTDFFGFLSRPIEWMYEYYNQYPALAVRRHPPLFGLFEAIVFSITGVSTFGAKLTNLLFCWFFAFGAYFMCLQFWKSRSVAWCTTLLICSTPAIWANMNTIFLDIACWSFALWAFYFYGKVLEKRSHKSLLLVIIFATLSLYTYPLTGIPFTGLALHFLITQYSWLKDKKVLALIVVAIFIVTPLLLFKYFMVKEHLQMFVGVTAELFKDFVPINDKTSFSYWLYYADLIFKEFSIQFWGVVLWLALIPWRRPSSNELLFFLCFVIGYLAFSWIASRNVRYAIYISLPLSPLVILVLIDTIKYVTRFKQSTWIAAICVTIISLLSVFQAKFFYKYPSYLSGMKQPVETILSMSPKPRILYVGAFDSAFIFYTRQLDEKRKAQVFRSNIQVEKPEGLIEFVKENDVDFIVVQDDKFTGVLNYEIYKKVLEDSVLPSQEFRMLKKFQLLFGSPSEEEVTYLNVYAR